MESDVSDSRPHFYSLLHIRLTVHTLISTPHCIHILMLIHIFIRVQTLILFLKHICALHFFHTFKHSHIFHLVYKLFFVITFSSHLAIHYSFSSRVCISTSLPAHYSVYPIEQHHNIRIQYAAFYI